MAGGGTPLVVVEFLSPSTTKDDLGTALRDASKPPTKWEVYEQILRVPYYVVYDRYEKQLRVFCLERDRYQLASLSEGRFWIEALGLGLGLWEGCYKGVQGVWLRWYDTEGWVPTLAERAEAEAQRADRLAAYLRSLGLDPDKLTGS